MLHQCDLVGRRSLRRQALLQPAERGRYRRVVVPQPLDELRRERRKERPPLIAAQRRSAGVVAMIGQAEQLVGERVGLLPGSALADEPVRQTAQVLDQHHTKGDRDGPQLPDRQGLHSLVRGQEPAQRFGIEAAVRVRDEGPGDSVDARKSGEWPIRKLGKLAIEFWR